MIKNNKNGNVVLIMLIIIVIIGTLLYFFLPKNFFGKSSNKSNTFGTFKNDKRYKNDGVPSSLKWKRSFAYDKKEEKQQGSYMRYMIDKNKDK